MSSQLHACSTVADDRAKPVPRADPAPTGFAALNLAPSVLQALEEIGYEQPSPIQSIGIGSQSATTSLKRQPFQARPFRRERPPFAPHASTGAAAFERLQRTPLAK